MKHSGNLKESVQFLQFFKNSTRFINFETMTRTVLALFFILALGSAKAQQDVTTFKSPKVSVTNRGEERLRAIVSPSLIVLDLRDSVITIEHEQSEITSFLEYQNEFRITRVMGKSGTVLQFLTEGDFVFSFYLRRRTIYVGKLNLSPQQHAVRFEEIQ